MNSVVLALAKLRPQYFKVSYSPQYKIFYVNHILNDPLHPLYQLRRRAIKEQRREGLWWNVTAAGELSKSSVVRNWSRRRLRDAFKQELKERGFDEKGKRIQKQIAPADLAGSVRLHVQAPLISAKYVDVRKETGRLVDILLGGMRAVPSQPRPPRADRRGSVRAS